MPKNSFPEACDSLPTQIVPLPGSSSRPLRQRAPRPTLQRPLRPTEIVIDDDEPAPSRPAAPFRPPRHPRGAPPRARGASHPESSHAVAQPDDLALARRLQAQEESRAAREEQAMRWRLDNLEREEAAAEAAAATAPRGARPPGRARGSGGGGAAPSATGPRSGRRNRWARGGPPLPFPGAMFGGGGPGGEDDDDGGLPGPSAGGYPFPFPRGGPFASLFTDLAALHQAVSGARAGVLPPHLLFSDADFGEDDYEMLLKLDEGVENRRGASKDAIKQLQTERVPRGVGAPSYGDCVVCLDGIGGGQTVRRLECGHAFHKGCIDKWLRQKACCPICQRNI